MEDVGPGEMGPVTIAFGWILDYPPNVGICTPQKQHRLKEKRKQHKRAIWKFHRGTRQFNPCENYWTKILFVARRLYKYIGKNIGKKSQGVVGQKTLFYN